ncbi:AAA family ATPase [Plebeiibacterium marinum]|uniref:AAA family ATPase n=1 Tax=Plebeiibacterium marinum TaxID=2992111 RepID=A0AAE3MET2_9BACT|nr:AAA family ATPase [Plebeiobacterium marinum]MCW3805742.1 AAA family ATPase [Plebeiobacterium marinum]
MIISISSLKGGTGKSTLSTNLAVCFSHMGYKTIIIDTDTNGSSIRWSGLRADDLPEVLSVSITDPKALRKNINSFQKDYDIVIIDGTPALSELASTIILISDLLLIPIKPGVLDLWATEMFIEKYEQALLIKQDINGYFILNQVNPRAKLTNEVNEVLKDFSISTLESKLNNRVAYSESVVCGLGVYEYKDPKAKEEITLLANEVLTLISNENI